MESAYSLALQKNVRTLSTSMSSDSFAEYITGA